MKTYEIISCNKSESNKENKGFITITKIKALNLEKAIEAWKIREKNIDYLEILGIKEKGVFND